MFVEERKEKILKILKEKNKVTVNELSDIFNISKVIIRKDLTQLENEGKITRTHGGAILKRKSVDKIILKDTFLDDIDEKKEMAQIIYDLIENNDIIFLDDSTTNVLVAQLLKDSNLSITVITAMFSIQQILIGSKNIKLISLGGVYNPDTDTFISEITRENLKKFNPTKVFIGVGGINPNKLLLNTQFIEEGKFKATALKIGIEKYIIAQNRKFYQDCIYNFATLNSNINIITSKKITPSLETIFQNKNIKIIKRK